MSDNNIEKFQIRNSTVDFLVFTKDAHEEGIEVRVQDGDIWLTQKAIGQLFDVHRSVVSKHLRNIYENGELNEKATCANFAQVADNGKTYQYKFYSLSAIIDVGCLYCVKTMLQKEMSSASDLVSRMFAGIPLSSGKYQPSGLSLTPLNPN